MAKALYDAVVTRYSSPATAALGRLLLSYLFPDLSAFATVEDLVSHLHASVARYRAAAPAEFLDRNQPPMFITLYFIVTRLPDSLRSIRDHFLSLDPTILSIDLLEKHLLAAETSVVIVGAARGTPRTPFFEGCSPSPLAPSYASAAAVDVLGAEDVGAASASGKHCSSKGKGGKSGGGGSGGGSGDGSGGFPTCAATGAVPAGAGSGGAGSRGAETEGADSGGAATEGAEPGGVEPGGAEPGGAEPGGAEPGGVETGGAEPWGAEPGGTEPGGSERGGTGSARVASRGASSRREVLSPQELREWFARRWGRAAGAGGTTAATGSGGTCPGGAGAAGPGGTAEAAGVGPTGVSAGASGGAGAAGSAGTRAAGATGVGAAGGVGAGETADAGPSEGAGAGAVGAGGAAGAGAAAERTGAVPTDSGGATRPRLYFVPLLEHVLGLPLSPGPAPPLECPQPVQSQSPLQPVSPRPAPSPYTGPTGGLAERRVPASRPASPARTACTSRRTSCPRPPAVPGTHQMTLRPSTAPLRVPLPSPPASSLPSLADPESDSLRAASPTVVRFLATVVTDPSLASTAASALVAELVDFAAHCRLDYAAGLVAESVSVCPPSVGGECALGTDGLEDRQEEFQCFPAALPHLVSTLLAPDAPYIPTRSYAEAIEGPYSSQWQVAMDAEMASWKSTGTYVDEVPPPGANIVSGMWIFRVKRPPGSPPVFKARYVARGFSQRQEVDYFHTFSPTPKMTTLRVLLHVATQRNYELHSLDSSTAFLQGSLHEEIWLRRPPGFTGSFPPGTQWSLRRPVYGLRQAPREWHDTLRTTLVALGFAPSTADPSLFLRTDTSLPPFYVLVYVDDLVFATADTAGLAHVKSELHKRHTCTDLGELRSYLGLQITRDRAQRTITLTQSHMVQQVLQRFDFTYSSPPREQPRSPPVLYVDNKAMLALCREHRLEHRTKHIALRYFLARELQQRGQLRLAYVASEANTADIFTKALPPGDHQRFCTMLVEVVEVVAAVGVVAGVGALVARAPPCLPCVEGRQRATLHSSSFSLTTTPLQTLCMDVWGPARVSGKGRECYFLLVVDDYTRYTTVFPLRTKGEVPDVLIPWIRVVRLQLRERFREDLPVFRLHSYRGGEFSSDLLRDFCRGEGILQTFTLPASPQQNGIAERRIGLVMEVAHTSMIHAASPHFLWPFAVRYASHQLNLWPRVSLLETSPTLRWTGKVGDVSVFRV
ncbi:unnamed protein product [Closterium sp. NIES-54]